LADTQIVGDAGDRQAPASHVADPVNGSRHNGGLTHGSNGVANGFSNGAVSGYSNGAASGHSNGAANADPNVADARYLAELADWHNWKVSPYWSHFLNGNGASNGHQNGGPQGSEGRPSNRGMAMEGMTPTGLARRLGR
jgi:hypothetical protein